MAPKKPKNKVKPAPKKPTRARKDVRENPGPAGIGHNLAALKENGAEVVEKFLKLDESMQSDMAGYRSDFAKLYEESANTLGIKKAVLIKELKRILTNKKAIEAEMELKGDEREQTILFRDAMEDTPFGAYAAGLLAEPDDHENQDDAVETGGE